jgi:hypothetical protein
VPHRHLSVELHAVVDVVTNFLQRLERR